MSTVIGNIILSFIQQLTKPTSAGVIQIIFAIVSVLLSVRFIGDQNITYPNATPRITAQSKICRIDSIKLNICEKKKQPN